MDNEEIMDNKEIVFSLNVEDLQCVAQGEIDRDLSADEIEAVKGRIQDSIPWYDCISYAIDDMQIERGKL